MARFRPYFLPALTCTVLVASAISPALAATDAARPASSPSPYFTPYFSQAENAVAMPDDDGFIRRWLLLEPMTKPNRSNQGFTGAYVRDAFAKAALPGPLMAIPQDKASIRLGGETLIWHAIDSQLFDVKLFQFAQSLGKTTYGVIFWATTVVESDRDIADAHLAVGSNSASMWWVNGTEAVALFGDRRMVMDDGVSPRLALHKGRNVIRGAIINGPGLSDFCVRFVDDAGKPLRNLKITLR